MGCYGSVKCKKKKHRKTKQAASTSSGEPVFRRLLRSHTHDITGQGGRAQRNREEALNINNKEQNETNKK